MNASLTIDTKDAIGFALDAAFIILVQKGSDNEREILKLIGGDKSDAPQKTPASNPPVAQMSLQAQSLGIFATHDTCHVIIVKRDSDNAKRIQEFIARHGKKLPRPTP